MLRDYINLSTRKGFNRSLGHFRVATEIVNFLGEGYNLADIVKVLEKEGMVNQDQTLPILQSLLLEKFDYKALAFNLIRDIQDIHDIYECLAQWNRFDCVIVYHHPQIGVVLVNPHSKEQWEKIEDFSTDELIVVYVKAVHAEDKEREESVLQDYKGIFNGKKKKDFSSYHDDRIQTLSLEKEMREAAEAEAKKAEAEARRSVASSNSASPTTETPKTKEKASREASGHMRMTPKYSVQVTNELFHNGNVEAWKNIIESYEMKHKGINVFIFHDGKRVNNLNSLFKWGKVKNGDVILFSVGGENIRGISKLQRYLFEGASNRFNRFLKKDLNKPLNLF